MNIPSMADIKAMLEGAKMMPPPSPVPKESQPLELKMLALLAEIESVAGIKPDTDTIRFITGHRNMALCRANGIITGGEFSLSLGYLATSVSVHVPFFYCSVNDPANNFATITTYKFKADSLDIIYENS